jgi:hypothetical protein
VRQHFDSWDPTERSDNQAREVYGAWTTLKLPWLRSCVEEMRVDVIAQFPSFEPAVRFKPSISPVKAYRRQE